MKKVINITYTKDWEVTNEGLTLPIIGYKSVGALFTRHYHNAIYLLAGLRPAARNLMEFLIQRMDEENIVKSDGYVREAFIKLIRGATDGEIEYSHDTVKHAFRQLISKRLINKWVSPVTGQSTRGIYEVNPEYFFKGEEKRRIEKITFLLEKGSYDNK